MFLTKKIYFLLILTVAAVSMFVTAAQKTELSSSARILLGKLFSPIEKERINSAIKLSDHNSIEVINNLMEVARNDKSNMVRRVAISSLGKLSAEEAKPLMLELINSDVLSIQLEAISSSAFLPDPLPQLLPAVLKQCESNNPVVRQKSVISIGQMDIDNSYILDTLLKLLNDINEGVRIAVCRVIAIKKIKEAFFGISELIQKDRADIVRKIAVETAAVLENTEFIPVLKIALEDSSPIVRITAARALAIYGNKHGLAEAIQGIKSLDPNIRILSCEVMGMLGESKSKIFLEQALNDFDLRVQRAAGAALRSLQSREKSK